MNNEVLSQINEHLLNNLQHLEVPNGAEQRTVGDLMSFAIKELLMTFSNPNIVELQSAKSKKALEDFLLIDKDGTMNYFNIVTYNVDAKFSMPNLASINKIKSLFDTGTNDILYIFVSYQKIKSVITIMDIDIKYVWEIGFDNLRIGSLGKGQLQISNMHKDIVPFKFGRVVWFDNLKKLVNNYHQKRLSQINKDALQWV